MGFPKQREKYMINLIKTIEEIIAKALGKTPAEIWPSRYPDVA